MDYRLVLSDLKIINLQVLLTVDNDVSCHVILGDFQNWPHGEKLPPEVFCKKAVLKTFAKFTGKHLLWSLFSAQVFSCEYCKIFKNTYFE